MQGIARKFGKTTVELNKDGRVRIVGEWVTNWGIVYPHNIEAFKQGVVNPCTGHVVQVIGMDSEVCKTHREWIYTWILNGFFDHLI